MIAKNRDGKIHALQLSTESSIRATQERSKTEIIGKLKEVATKKIDEQTEALVEMIGDNQVDYHFLLALNYPSMFNKFLLRLIYRLHTIKKQQFFIFN